MTITITSITAETKKGTPEPSFNQVEFQYQECRHVIGVVVGQVDCYSTLF